jgi:hypothetical protein
MRNLRNLIGPTHGWLLGKLRTLHPELARYFELSSQRSLPPRGSARCVAISSTVKGTHYALVLLSTTLLVTCAPGDSNSEPGLESGQGGSVPSPSPPPVSSLDPDPVPSSSAPGFEPAPAGLRRLTVREYQNSVRSLLGVEPPLASQLEPDDSVGGFVSIGARRVAMSAAAIGAFESVSYRIAQQVFGDAAGRNALLGCEPSRAEDVCVQDFLSRQARRFYRRPPTPDEVTRLTAVVQTVAEASDVWAGLSYGLAALLQSPNFLYRVELGEPEQNSPWRRYTAFELASRLSFLLTKSTPDDALLDAAEAGDLSTEAGLQAQIDRLMGSPGVRDTVTGFFSEQLLLGGVDKINKDPNTFPEYSAELVAAMRRELDLLVEDWVWTQERPLSELLVSSETFVNDVLADFYGLPAPDAEGFVRVRRPDDDPRVGLLGAAGFLALNAGYTETSSTKRGRYVVEQLLCLAIPEPPDGVVTSLDTPPPGTHLTMRERVKIHQSSPICAGCHSIMDPVGLPLEHFDAMGRYRADDQGRSIDASGEIDGVAFDGLRGLASTLAADQRVDACVVRRFYEFSLGHNSTRRDNPAIQELEASYDAARGDFTEMIRTFVRHDAFQLASEPTL